MTRHVNTVIRETLQENSVQAAHSLHTEATDRCFRMNSYLSSGNGDGNGDTTLISMFPKLQSSRQGQFRARMD